MVAVLSFSWNCTVKIFTYRISQFHTFRNRPFIKNVAIVATGSAGAQAIGMLFAPLITRLYGPEAFGLQSIFTSLVGLLTVVATMSFQVAIVLPKRDDEAVGLAKLSLITAVCVALIAAFGLHYSGHHFLELVDAEAIEGFVYLIPLAMITAVLANVLYQWLIRKKLFGLNARYTVATTLLINITKYGVGLFNPSAIGLILINILGALFGVIITFVGFRRHQRVISTNSTISQSKPTSIRIGKLARKYSDFPIFRTPQTLISVLSQSLPMLMLAGYFGAAIAGQYSIVIAVLGLPTNLIANSVRAVFYPRVNEAMQNGENVRSLIIKTSVALMLSGLPIFAVIMFYGPQLFELVFGVDWKKAGEYSQWVAVLLLLQYISVPTISAIPVLKFQGRFLVFEVVSVLLKILMLWVGFFVFQNDLAAVALFSISGAILYVILIVGVVARSVGSVDG